MKPLYNTLKESLLGGFDNLESSMDPIKEIEQFIKDNYKIYGKLQISKEPNNDGKYEVSCDGVKIKNKNITSLVNNIFEWGEIKNDFDCYDCKHLITLEGAPKKVDGNFRCSFCNSLTSLEGSPKEVGGNFRCTFCKSLISLEGAPEEVGEGFYCNDCVSLTSLKGAPEEVGENFNCSHCDSLTSLKGCPKKVGGFFGCYGCKQDFTVEDVRKICGVVGVIYTK